MIGNINNVSAHDCPSVVQTAADKAAVEAAALAASERRKDTARAALAAILADNTPQAAKDGIAMLRMLIVNLINQPNVPRYRRITTRCAMTNSVVYQHVRPELVVDKSCPNTRLAGFPRSSSASIHRPCVSVLLFRGRWLCS